MERDMAKLMALAESIVERAKRRGAEVAEVVARGGSELSAKVRLGEPELIREAQSRGVSLRVISGGRSGATYSSDTTEGGLEALVEDALGLMQLAQPDEFAGPPDPKLLLRARPAELDLFDPATAKIDAETARAQALAAEDAARRLDARVTNSDGAEFERSASTSVLVTSGGFKGGYSGTYAQLSMSPVIDDAGGKKQTGSYWDGRRFRADLEKAEAIGEESARRTLAKLGARKVESAEVPVIFDPDAGRALLSALMSCVDGHALYRRSSYLCDREGDTIASPLVTIVDDPLIPRAPGSRPYDGEGLPSQRNVVVERGVLRSYLLDTYSARKLKKESTASASRGMNAIPAVSATNFLLSPGDRTPESILREVDRGLYVTSMMGFGFSPVTGDFSRGAEGFWIEKGQKAFPVSEITISLGFNDLWKRIDAVGNDLNLKSRFTAPTIRVSRMTVAGA
jgi:PmbA protein